MIKNRMSDPEKSENKKINVSVLETQNGQNEVEEDENGNGEQNEQAMTQPKVNEEKKEKKTLRFQLPESTTSEESFTSVLPVNVPDPVVRVSEQLNLKKYILAPLQRSRPRTAMMMPCISTEELDLESTKLSNTICLANSSPSKQLFEIFKNSPSPSEADMQLIDSTYLRKLEAMKEAIKNGADVNTFRDRLTPLMIATDIGDERLVRYLLSVPKINLNFSNIFGQTPLMVAIKNAFDKIAFLLLRHKADVNISDNMGKTPLHEALFQQRPYMVKLLLAFGANYEQSDVFNERPMYTAAVKKPNLQCFKLLLKMGAAVEYANNFGMTLLNRAILNFTNLEIIEILIINGASVNSRDLNTGKTPLHFAALINDFDIAQLLLKKGANANAEAYNKIKPYEEAILHKSVDVAQLLFPLTTNANIKALNTIKNQKQENERTN